VSNASGRRKILDDLGLSIDALRGHWTPRNTRSRLDSSPEFVNVALGYGELRRLGVHISPSVPNWAVVVMTVGLLGENEQLLCAVVVVFSFCIKTSIATWRWSF
jgi:hypothetical protein